MLFDPVLKIEDATVHIDSILTTYLRSFDWSGKTARFDIRIPYQKATWEGLLDGSPATAVREGIGDPRFRLSVNFVGSPALKGKEFQAYRASHTTNTVVGAALAVSVPLGQYEEDKLLNLGQNRFVFRPQIGAVHTRGPWSFELTGSASLYSDNNDFLSGNKLEQRPLLALEAHVTRKFRNGIWAAVSAGSVRAGDSAFLKRKKMIKKRNLSLR